MRVDAAARERVQRSSATVAEIAAAINQGRLPDAGDVAWLKRRLRELDLSEELSSDLAALCRIAERVLSESQSTTERDER